MPSSPQLHQAQQRKTQVTERRVRDGENFVSIARELYGDPRLACMLEDLNPGISAHQQSLVPGQKILVADRDAALRWAVRMGMALGLSPNQGNGTLQRRRWRGFYAAPKTKPKGTELQQFLQSASIHGLIDKLDVLNTVGRGQELWRYLEHIDASGLDEMVARRPRADLQKLLDDERSAHALDEAIFVRVRSSCSRHVHKAFDTLQHAIDCTAQQSKRCARFVFNSLQMDPEKRFSLLSRMGLSADELERLNAAQPQLKSLRKAMRGLSTNTDVFGSQLAKLAQQYGAESQLQLQQKLVRNAVASQAVRDRLCLVLLGLEPVIVSLQDKLPKLARVVAMARAELTRPAGIAIVTQQVLPLHNAVRRELGICNSESAAAMCFDALLSQAHGAKLHPALKATVALLELLSPALFQVDTAGLDRGLGSVLLRLEKENTGGSIDGKMNVADLCAFASVQKVRRDKRQQRLADLSEIVQRLVRTYRQCSMLENAAQAGPRRVRALLDGLLTVAEQDAARPNHTLLFKYLDELMSELSSSTEHGLRTSDIERCGNLVADETFISRLTEALPLKLPACGRRYLNTRSLAIFVVAALLEDRVATNDVSDAESIAKLICDCAGQCIELCMQSLQRCAKTISCPTMRA